MFAAAGSSALAPGEQGFACNPKGGPLTALPSSSCFALFRSGLGVVAEAAFDRANRRKVALG
jgi:hypothetical protein